MHKQNLKLLENIVFINIFKDSNILHMHTQAWRKNVEEN